MWGFLIALIVIFSLILILFFIGQVFYSLVLHMKIDKEFITGPLYKMDARGLRYENEFRQYDPKDIYITNKEGLRLHAIEVDRGSKKWAILSHGYMGRNGELVDVCNFFIKEGYNVLSISQRAHNKSEGDTISMGYYESEDLLDWIQYIVKRDPDCSIVLYGVSMGAATVMMTLGKDIPRNIKAAIEDCGYTSAWDEFSYQLKKMTKLPSFPIVHVANLITKIRGGFQFKQANPLNAVNKSRIPILFIHGTKDDFVPTNMVYKLYHYANYPKQLLLIENGEHAVSRFKDPELYFSTLKQWIQQFA